MWWARLLNNIAGVLSIPTPVSTSSYESITTITVGAGGTSAIDFTSIPSTYKHLQIRGINQTNRATYNTDNAIMLLGNGSIDTGANYSKHSLFSDYQNGALVYADGVSGASNMSSILFTTTGVSGAFGAFVVDIYDYANTSKYKTVKVLSGADGNGTVAGYNPSVGITSGNWRNTAAITNIRLTPQLGTLFNQYSQFALYGIKG
jgi:hypothetical protein